MTAALCEAVDPSSSQREQLERIMAVTPCRKNFVCLTPRFRCSGRVELTDSGRAVKCLGHEQATCGLAIPFADGTYCACLMRLYIARAFGV